MPKATIEKLAVVHSDAHANLMQAVAALEEAQARLEAKHMPQIRRLLDQAAKTETALREAVAAEPELFQKPKTMTVAGIRFGFMKGPGGYFVADEGAVIERIKKLCTKEERDKLIAVKESLRKAGFDELDGATLKKLGVEVENDKEVVVVKPVDGKVSQFVKNLLKLARKEE